MMFKPETASMTDKLGSGRNVSLPQSLHACVDAMGLSHMLLLNKQGYHERLNGNVGDSFERNKTCLPVDTDSGLNGRTSVREKVRKELLKGLAIKIKKSGEGWFRKHRTIFA